MENGDSTLSSTQINRLATDAGFNNKTILITGGTGLLGKVLIEKLLRSCPLVKKIYIVIRIKREKQLDQRMKELFSSPVFDLLKQTRGEEILQKLVPLSGDMLKSNLGLSQANRKMISDEVEIVFHSAATVRFDEPFKHTVLTNTRSTKMMLELAKECKKLLSFVYVSTAYCHTEERILYEKPYPPPANPDRIIKIAELLEDSEIYALEKKLLGNAVNIYAYSKALAESLVVDEMENLPALIMRPSIVVPALREPMKGWIDNINGPLGLLIAAGKGILRTMYCNSKGYADFLPVDMTANAILVGTCYAMIHKKRTILNLTSSSEYKISWEDIVNTGHKISTTTMPFNWIVWYPGGGLKSSKVLHYICVVLFHYIPALILDGIIILTGNKPVLCKIQNRITSGFRLFEFYANNQWDFDNVNAMEVRKWMNDTEREVYKVDAGGFDVDAYVTEAIRMARRHILKEPDDTIPTAKRHLKVMWAVDRLCKILLAFGFVYYVFQYFMQ